MLAAQLLNENELAKLKAQYKKYIDPTMGSYNIEKLFTGVPYAWVSPDIFALYAAIDSYDTYKLQQYQEQLLNDPSMSKLKSLLLNIEIPVTLVVAKMEDSGICIDLDFVNKLNKKYHDGLDKATADLLGMLEPYSNKIVEYQSSGLLDNPINFNSAPQLNILVYDVLKIKPIEEFGKSTEKDALKALAHPFAATLLKYRHYNKMITSFTEALPQLCSAKDGKIHASFNQMGKQESNVRTGRFSSTDPNLQQIPSHEKVMRLIFKASPGHVIVGGDFSAQEPRVLTHMCQDPTLIDTFNKGRDPYATIMSKVRHMDYWDCMERHEDGTANPTGKEIRSVAKVLMLGIMYGMGAKLMAQNLGVSVDECKEILNNFFETFPNIRDFTLNNEQMARELGYVEDYMGRRRHLPDINLPEVEVKAYNTQLVDTSVFLESVNNMLKLEDKEESKRWLNLYKEKYSKNYDSKVKFKELAKKSDISVKDNGAFISKTLTQCTNARIQGGAATLTKKAMIQIANNKRLQEIGFKLLIPVHDELLGEVPEEYADECEKLLVDCMINAGKPECTVAMKCDTYVVKHWYADEVNNTIYDSYLKSITGNASKGIAPISEEDAIKKLQQEYPEFAPETIVSMCNKTFNLLSDKL